MKKETFEKMQTILFWSFLVGLPILMLTLTVGWLAPVHFAIGFCLALLILTANVDYLVFEKPAHIITAFVLALVATIGTFIAISNFINAWWFGVFCAIPFAIGAFYFHFADL